MWLAAVDYVRTTKYDNYAIIFDTKTAMTRVAGVFDIF